MKLDNFIKRPVKKIKKVFPLGFVDHSRNGFAIDAVSDGKIDIKNYYPLRGLRQPDGIAAFTAGDRHFVLTANEGAPVNDYKAWTDVTSVQELVAQGICCICFVWKFHKFT